MSTTTNLKTLLMVWVAIVFVSPANQLAWPATITWTGVNGNWADVYNAGPPETPGWDTAEPTSLDIAEVDNGSTVTIDTNGEQAYDVHLGNGAGTSGALNITGGTLDIENKYHIAYNGGDATVTQSGGVVTVKGNYLSLTNSALGTGTYTLSGGTLNTAGRNPGAEIGHIGPGVFNLQGGTWDSGSRGIRMGGGSTGDGTINMSGGTLKSAKILHGTLGGTWAFNFTGGTLHAGAVEFALDNSGAGILAPGLSVGTTAITGDYTQGNLASLLIEIDRIGTGGTDYDLVTVTGTADLDGYLDIDLGSFTPNLGDYFDVLTANTITGADQLVLTGDSPGSYSWSVSTEDVGSQALRLTVVPEPSTLVLLVMGGLVLVLRLRRRKRSKA